MALHLRTLSAVMLYFHKGQWTVATAVKIQLVNGEVSDNSRLRWNIIIATIPVLIAGFLIKNYAETELGNSTVITATALVFGLLLGIADMFAPQTRALEQLN